MPIRKAGRWVVTVSLDHKALEVYQGFKSGHKSAMVCSALLSYNANQKTNRNDAAKEKLRDRKMYRLEKDLKVADYRIHCIQMGDSDPGDGEDVYLKLTAKDEARSLRGGRF